MQQQPSNNTFFLEQSELYFGFLPPSGAVEV
jgi:hypothetical protein